MENIGIIHQIIGPVIDIKFAPENIPELLTAIIIKHDGKEIVAEVAQHVGDTLTTKKEPIFFEPMPTFPPELFALVSPVNSIKAKHFQKGVMQLAQEGAVQVYHTKYNEIIIGAVGALQFEVFEYRLTNEYNSNIRMENLDFSIACWIKNTDIEYVENNLDSRIKLVFDHFERPILLFPNSFTLNYFTQKHKDIELVEALSVNSTFNGE